MNVTIPRGALAAGLVVGLQGVAALVWAVVLLVEVGQGASSNAARGVAEAVLYAVFAAMLGALAVGLVKGRRWSRTPTILWSILLLPVIWTLATSDQVALAGVVAVLALVGALGASTIAAARTETS